MARAFQSFTTLADLYISQKLSPLVEHPLQELAEALSVTLPSARGKDYRSASRPVYPFLRPQPRPVQEDVVQFASARQFSSHPITVSEWDSKSI